MMDGESRDSLVKILFFAKARELSGLKESRAKLPANISYQSLLDTIIEKFGLESIRDSVILSLNEEYLAANGTLNLSDQDEIAVIPPLSGG
ncbi:molybdopterin synthase sulfur carrier subunit [Neodiprion pinetum]|uniref:Molybdopterin synthase sulfur carrier subunit n=1 Tax=Neodiprion lecontei TaxID=441921 RepID=A0A6J0BZS1_NEOLC|nr:molybdopterin synthase sulfur carrier subunit [Neodiprion lecontei]XP_046476687.1 molybdopterin synthase sulfur carrier subunit [Neodiprion pinetum]